MVDGNTSGLRDQAALTILMKNRTSVAPTPFCGYAKDPDSLEDLLWQYAEGEMEYVDQERLEEHIDSCEYCLERLSVICRSIQTVDEERGFSAEKVRILLNQKDRGQREGLAQKIRHHLESIAVFLYGAWKPLVPAVAMVVVCISLYVHFHGPMSLREAINSVGLKGLPERIEPENISQALSFHIALPDVENARSLLPELQGRVPMYFLSLGFIVQSLNTIIEHGPLKGTVRPIGERLAWDLEESLRGLDVEGPVLDEAVLFRARLVSGLYGTKELSESLRKLQDLSTDLAASSAFVADKAQVFLEFGRWLSFLNLYLHFQSQGMDMEKQLKIILHPGYVETMEKQFHHLLPDASQAELGSAFTAMKEAATQIQKGPLSSEEARTSVRAVEDIVRFANRRRLGP